MIKMTVYCIQKYDKKAETWRNIYSGLVDEELAIKRYNEIIDSDLEGHYQLVLLIKFRLGDKQ